VTAPIRDQWTNAFYEDEWGTAQPNGLHANRFVASTAEYPNDLDPAVNRPFVTYEDVPRACQRLQRPYSIFVPPPLRAAVEEAERERRAKPKVKISLLFGVAGTDFNMFGLRTAFASKNDRVLINVPGIEAGGAYCPAVKTAQWGISITALQIQMLFIEAKLQYVDWEIVLIACYSAGYMGFNGTLNNDLIPLDKVQTAIIYDDLYRGDTPVPGDNTRRALAKLLKARTPPANIVTYDVTPGGVPEGPINGRRVAVPVQGIVNLRTRTDAVRALIHARVLDAAVKEGIIQANQLPPAIATLRHSLPARGTVISQVPLPYRSGTPAGTPLAEWGKQNRAAIAQLRGSPKSTGFDLMQQNQLVWPGWDPFPEHQLLHVGFMAEFAWEYLAG
jgi:hypothetical protein